MANSGHEREKIFREWVAQLAAEKAAADAAKAESEAITQKAFKELQAELDARDEKQKADAQKAESERAAARLSAQKQHDIDLQRKLEQQAKRDGQAQLFFESCLDGHHKKTSVKVEPHKSVLLPQSSNQRFSPASSTSRSSTSISTTSTTPTPPNTPTRSPNLSSPASKNKAPTSYHPFVFGSSRLVVTAPTSTSSRGSISLTSPVAGTPKKVSPTPPPMPSPSNTHRG